MNKMKMKKITKKRIFTAAALCLALTASSVGAMGTLKAVGKMITAPLSVWSEVDWGAVDSEIDAVPHTETVQSQTKIIDIGTGTDVEVPTETLRKLAGKNVTLAMHTGDGIAVSAFGREVETVNQNLKITLTDKEDMIPEYVSQKILPGVLYSKMFAMEEKVNYDIRLNIHFSLGKDYAGKYANLYHFDEQTENMVYDSSFIITTNGMAMFSLDRGDEYILTVTDELRSGASVKYTVAAGDNLTQIAKKNGVSLKALIAANPSIKDADKIYPGEVIAIIKQ